MTNTNKLIRQYEYATGLKTGYTSVAGFCVSASAKKENIELVAVIMGGTDSKSRFQDAVTLLNSGFACCSLYTDENRAALPKIQVKGGVEGQVGLQYADEFSYVSTDGSNLSQVERVPELPEEVTAPVEKGDRIGRNSLCAERQRDWFYRTYGGRYGGTAVYGDYIGQVFRIFLL